MASTVKAESAGGAPKPVKRMRTSKPKTKTGCRNCKQRRIKCDEKRPACTQCVRSRKVCTGYPPPAHSSRPFEEIRIAPKPTAPAGPALTPIRQPIRLPPRRPARQPRHPTPPQTPLLQQNGLTMWHRPSQGLIFDLEEGQYFELFRSSTASELSGFFDNVFWTKTVLRECHTEEAVKHAVVALGALYKTLEKTTESPPTSPPDNASLAVSSVDAIYRHWEVAIKQYSKACNALMMANSQDQKSHRTRLMASVLLACFDSFIGDHKQAIVQIQNGLGLLEKLRAERRRSFMPKPEEPVEDELIQMFTRLAIQAKSYDMAFHFPEPYVIHLVAKPAEGGSPADAGSPVSIHQEPIPERFSSLIEARIAWDTLCEQCFRAMETMSQYADAGPNLLPQSMMVYGRAFAARIQSWSDAFDPILASRTGPDISTQEKAGIAVLKMFQIMGQILYLMTFSDSEMQFDSFRKHFEAIVDLATEVVGDEERRAAERRCPNRQVYCPHHRHHPPPGRDGFVGHEYAANHIKASFSADLGIVPPLYVVAAKSRDPLIRRRAIQLLRSSARREGMWDSELMAQIGMWLVDIEEDDELYCQESPFDTFGHAPPSPTSSPPATSTRTLSTSPTSTSPTSGAGDVSEVPLGPGGNARWDARRTSVASATSGHPGRRMSTLQTRVVPPEKRVLVKSAEFDLREHKAVLRCGTRGLRAGTPDVKFRETHITW